MADAEVHGAVVFLPTAYRIGVRLTESAQAERHLAAAEPGILVAVGFEKPADLIGFGFALNVDDAAVFDRERHRLAPAAGRKLRRHFPHDGAVGRAGDR